MSTIWADQVQKVIKKVVNENNICMQEYLKPSITRDFGTSFSVFFNLIPKPIDIKPVSVRFILSLTL